MALAVPVVLCGKSPQMASSFIEAMKPEYDVIHVIHSTSVAKDELPILLADKPIKPSSGLGSNAHNASIATSGHHPTPQAVIVGKGFSEADFNELKALEAGQNVPWMYPDDKTSPPGGDVDLVTFVADRAKRCLKEHGVVPRESGKKDVIGGGETWHY